MSVLARFFRTSSLISKIFPNKMLKTTAKVVQSLPKEENPDLPGQWELSQFRGLLFEFSNAVAGPA